MGSKFDCGIINTGAGNLTSLQQAILSLGLTVTLIDNAKSFQQQNFDKIIIPGQGRFGTVMNTLKQKGFIELLQQWQQQKKPILGICVGMQIFFEGSDEDLTIPGLGWFEGRAEALAFPKRPMVGWSSVDPVSTFLKKGNAYFVNSFAIKQSPFSIATTEYGEQFCSAVKKNNLIGVQFHPEKSSSFGVEVMKTCLVY